MTDDGFLSRWSRRKHATNVSARPEAPVSEAIERKDETVPLSSQGVTESVEEFDLSTLPPLESISAATDVAAFLRKGVPPALSREALRRAWIADPAIRDFVGLAENAWDFNDPDAMPGFGPLDYTPEELRDLVARIVGGVRRETDDIAGPAAPHHGTDESPSSAEADPHELPEEAAPAAVAGPAPRKMEHCELEGELEHVAARDLRERRDGDQQKAEASLVRRTHGGALPK
jgi:hypothetical protein